MYIEKEQEIPTHTHQRTRPVTMSNGQARPAMRPRPVAHGPPGAAYQPVGHRNPGQHPYSLLGAGMNDPVTISRGACVGLVLALVSALLIAGIALGFAISASSRISSAMDELVTSNITAPEGEDLHLMADGDIVLWPGENGTVVLPPLPGAKVLLTDTISGLAGGVEIPIDWDAVVYDDDAFFDSGVDASIFTAPEDGRYLFGATVALDEADVAGYVSLSGYVNGESICAGGNTFVDPSIDNSQCSVTCMNELAMGDTVSMVLRGVTVNTFDLLSNSTFFIQRQ